MTQTLRIEGMGHRGEGIARTPAGPVFVPYTLPGETVRASHSARPDHLVLAGVDEESAERVAPICPYFGACGGCVLQHWSQQPYRAWKRDLVCSALAQAGIQTPVEDLIDAHGEGRRRAVFHARAGEVGFSALRSHDLVPIAACPVLAPSLGGALPASRIIARALAGLRKPLDIHVTATDAGLDVDLRGSGPLPAALTATLAAICAKAHIARLTRHGELVVQRLPPTIAIGRAKVALPPGAFLQPTEAGEQTLARLVVGHCAGARRIADLFAGVGPFALRLAETARVTAADADGAAIAALSRAATATPGLRRIEAQTRDLFRRPLIASELDGFDAVIFDPPRQGAEAQSRALAISAVRRVIAVSCNAATFARDAAILTAGGYRIAAVTPVDQFRYSAHVEIVARFEK